MRGLHLLALSPWTACFSDSYTARTETTALPLIVDAMEALERAGGSTRNLEVRVARAHLKYAGLAWPPRLPATADDRANAPVVKTAMYWLSTYMMLHNIGLCPMSRDRMAIAAEL
jgi:hypothetical protein